MIPRAMAAKCRLTAKSSSVLLQRIYTTKTKKQMLIALKHTNIYSTN